MVLVLVFVGLCVDGLPGARSIHAKLPIQPSHHQHPTDRINHTHTPSTNECPTENRADLPGGGGARGLPRRQRGGRHAPHRRRPRARPLEGPCFFGVCLVGFADISRRTCTRTCVKSPIHPHPHRHQPTRPPPKQTTTTPKTKGPLERTPLLIAADHCHLPVLRLLLAKGADLRDVDRSNANCLHLAVRFCFGLLGVFGAWATEARSVRRPSVNRSAHHANTNTQNQPTNKPNQQLGAGQPGALPRGGEGAGGGRRARLGTVRVFFVGLF